jgi:hypothetical protein
MPPRKRVKTKTPKLGKPGFTITSFRTPGIRDYVVAELRYESPVAYTRSRFAAPAPGASDAERLNRVLEKFDISPRFVLNSDRPPPKCAGELIWRLRCQKIRRLIF